MLLGTVIGTVVSTRKEDALVGFKLLVVRVEEGQVGSTGKELVACDTLGAGVGERVLVATGGAARTSLPAPAPTDATIVGIIDTVDIME